MQLIGLIGGMSWQSTAEYYRLLNTLVEKRLGGHHSARVLLYSVDFAVIERLQAEDRWNDAARILADAARSLQAGGADFVMLCTNTMHKVANEVQAAINVPLLHICDALGDRIRAVGIRRVALLGTRFTMSQTFYRERLERAGLAVSVPTDLEQADVHRIIYDELCHGVITSRSRQSYGAIIRYLVDRGAQGIILGCTEIELLVSEADSPVPIFKTAALHCEAAADRALAGHAP